MRYPVAPRSAADTSGDVQRVLGKLESLGRSPDIVRMVANWTPGFRPFVLTSDALLFRGFLAPQTRECIVLCIAALRDDKYEWDEHVPMSAKVGITTSQHDAIAAAGGQWHLLPDDLFDDQQRAAARLAQNVLLDDEIELDVWDATCDVLGRDAALEVIFAVAWWGGYVATLTRSLMHLNRD